MKKIIKLLTCTILTFSSSMLAEENKEVMNQAAKMPELPQGAHIITLGAGCFWCIEAAFAQIDGVYHAISGYMGGTVENPTYEDICTGTSGHAEVVQVIYNPEVITLDKILAWFWDLHDPTQLNRQGNDVGTQYRSALFYENEGQKLLLEAARTVAQENFDKPIVTEITKSSTFYPAEAYHQAYYFRNKSNNGYCKYVVEPKLKKLKLKH